MPAKPGGAGEERVPTGFPGKGQKEPHSGIFLATESNFV